MSSENCYKQDSLEKKWLAIQENLSLKVGQSAYISWIKKISPSGIDNGCAYLKVPTRFVKDNINTKYSAIILELLKEHDNNIQSIQLFCGVAPKALQSNQLKDLEKKEAQKLVQLPLWPEATRGLPNSIIRGCLFSAIHNKSAKYLKRAVILEEKNLKIIFTGQQLTQSDLNVWEQILHISREQYLGHDVFFTANAFLKALGKSTGKNDHEYLKNVLSKLNACSVEITHNNMTYMGSLIDGGIRDEENHHYKLSINPKIARLYSEGFTLTNWEERKKIGNRPLVLWLHSYISSHVQIYPTKIETFHRLCGSGTESLRRFKAQLKEALQFLLDEQIIKGFEIKNHLVTIDNIPTETQEKFINLHGSPLFP